MIRTYDDASRTAALDGVLRALLARFPDARYAEAARALFGLPSAEPGQNLTVRRELAAGAAGHEVHHFRKRVEPRLIDQLVSALLTDADRFTRCRVIAPRLAPATDRQPVPADPFAWEVAEHKEALSRLWAAIYALRAPLLAVERLISFGVRLSMPRFVSARPGRSSCYRGAASVRPARPAEGKR